MGKFEHGFGTQLGAVLLWRGVTSASLMLAAWSHQTRAAGDRKRDIFMYACMHVCMYACMHVCMYACVHVCMYACMHVCMYACMSPLVMCYLDPGGFCIG